MSTIINATTTNGVVIQPDNSGSLVLQTNSGTTALTINTSQHTTLAGKLITASSGIQFSDSSTQTAAASPYVLKNRIINGDMRIDQRNAGASVTPTSDGSYNLDRWKVGLTQASKFSVQQSSTAPNGFSYSALITSLSAYSVVSGDTFLFQQNIEGYNTADLAWGTANAQTVTLSFWVRSSLTGTFGGSIINSAANRAYLFSYTISSANTWEQKTITVTGDTTGTWVGATNGIGIGIRFGLGSGSTFSGTTGVWQNGNIVQPTGTVSVVGTNGATWYITGVQLEIGTSATPFERRLYNQELANCQRYYQKIIDPPMHGVATGSTYGGASRLGLFFANTMRATPTLAINGTFTFWNGSGATTGVTLTGYWTGGLNGVDMDITMASAYTQGQSISQYLNGDQNKYVTLSAEL